MSNYNEISKILLDMGNAAAGIAAYETPAKPMVDVKMGLKRQKKRNPDSKPINWNKMLKRQQDRRGE